MLPRCRQVDLPDVRLLQLEGELDLSSADFLDALRDHVLAGRSSGRGERVVLDLGGVSFLDCSSIRQLHRVVEAAGPETVVVCPDGAPRRLLAYTGFSRQHAVVLTLQAARVQLGSGTGPGLA